MEVIGAAASIAGLIGLAGQCISGAQKLRDFYLGVAKASTTIASFLGDVNSLLKALDHARDLLKKLERLPAPAADIVQLTSLKFHLEDCNKDVGDLLRTAGSLHSTSNQGAKVWFRKSRIAINRTQMTSAHDSIQRRRAEISLALSTIGRSMDVHAALKMASVEGSVDTSNQLSEALLQKSQAHQETLDRIESVSQAVSEMSISSMKSLADIQASVRSSCGSFHSLQSRHSSAAPTSPMTGRTGPATRPDEAHPEPYSCPGRFGDPMSMWRHICVEHNGTNSPAYRYPQWSCIKLLDVRSCFRPSGPEEVRCGLCGYKFTEPADWSLRVFHIWFDHDMFRCDLSQSCISEASLLDHLDDSHNAKFGEWSQFILGSCRMKDADIRTQGGDIARINGGAQESAIGWLSRKRQHGDDLKARSKSTFASTDDVPCWRTSWVKRRRRSAGEAEGQSLHSRTSDVEASSSSQSFLMSSWDSTLLRDWTGARDRVNRWMLHALVADGEQLDMLKRFLQKNRVIGLSTDEQDWSRLVLKHRFLDGAATGQENFIGEMSTGSGLSLKAPSIYSASVRE